jgi:hypothetical protein
MDSRAEVMRLTVAAVYKQTASQRRFLMQPLMQLRYRMMPAVILAALAFSAAAADEKLPKGEDIMDKFVDVTGGKAAYEKVHTEKWTGTFEFVGKDIKGSITSYRAEPAKTFTTIELEGVGTVEDGTDGETSWTRSAMQGPRIKQGDERAASLREAVMRSPIEWRKQYKQAETAGIEKIGDQSCYKVVLTPNEGKPETRYFDQKSNLMVKMTLTLASPMGEIPTETILSDYKEQDGLLSPHKIQQSAMGQEFLITIAHVEYNVDIPQGRFDLPADVKALMAK